MHPIRWLIRRDYYRVLEIERQCFDDPWTVDEFLRVLGQRNAIGHVVERRDTIVGYMVYELHKDRIVLLNIAVAPECQRQGLGSAMLDKLKGKIHMSSRSRLVVEAWDANLPAHLWLQSQGFTATGIERAFYCNGGDAYRFEWRAEQPARVRIAT